MLDDISFHNIIAFVAAASEGSLSGHGEVEAMVFMEHKVSNSFHFPVRDYPAAFRAVFGPCHSCSHSSTARTDADVVCLL